MTLTRSVSALSNRCTICRSFQKRCEWCNEDASLVYLSNRTITIKRFSTDPEWWIWQLVNFLKVSAKNKRVEHLVVVPRTIKSKLTVETFALFQDTASVNFVVYNEPSYVLSAVIFVKTFPEKISVSFEEKTPIGKFYGAADGIPFEFGLKRRKRNRVKYMAEKPCEILLQFLDHPVPTFCCISIRKLERPPPPPSPFDIDPIIT